MIITNVQWHPYRLPLRNPFVTAHGMMAIRKGIIVEITTEQGIVGVGEIAPLPEFSRVSLAAAHSALTILAPHLYGKTLQEALDIVISPPTLYGLEIALLDALGKTQNVSISILLAPPHTPIRPHIAV